MNKQDAGKKTKSAAKPAGGMQAKTESPAGAKAKPSMRGSMNKSESMNK